MERRVFTLEAVNALVPRLELLVGRQLERRTEIEALLARLGRELGDVPERIVLDPADPTDVREMKRELVSRIEAYRQGWREVEELGAVLKDPRMGLLDFYGMVDGKAVWLCWRYGESECAFYHALEEGFSGRKPIGASVKQRLLN
ncbi:MAG: DUF2203 domain-containing protein [Deltaproteobacteria bacterium]|nr:DUF2203 domain-containing protein [Deltaproteobacteria bacterium]